MQEKNTASIHNRVILASRAGKLGLFEWNTGATEAYWTVEHYELFGLEPGSPATFEAWLARVHPDDRDRVTRSAANVIAEVRSGKRIESHHDEYRALWPDGTVVWLETVAAIECDGNVVMRGAVRDITERKRAEEALRESEEQFRVLIQNLVSAVAMVNERGEFTIVNKAFLRLFDLDEQAGVLNLKSRDWGHYRVFDEQGRLLDVDEHPVRKAILTGTAVKDVLVAMQSPGRAELKWLLISAAPILNAQGNLHQLITTYHDITERKQAEERIQTSLREKEVLLKEIHHRVKNNLQVISSLVDLQADALKEPGLRQAFADTRDRVRSMALVHEKLYQSESLAQVEFAEYARSLLGSLWRAHRNPATRVELKLDLEPVSLSIVSAIPCGLLLNELTINALKHAFRGRTEGEVTVGLRSDTEGRTRLSVRDNGVGMPAGQEWRQSPSLGLRLVHMLAGQLNATVEVRSEGGTEFLITLERPAGEGGMV